MDSKTQHRSKLGTKATLLLCACDSNALGSEMTPILAVIALAFPGENVNLLVALPPLCIIPASLIAAKLSYHISRKTILTIGQILFIIGGIGGAFAPNFEFLLATRVFFGLGCGLVYPIVPTLISHFFAGQERVGMMGAANAVGSVIAMVFSTLSGTLAVIGWHVPFFVNIFFVFVLIMQLVFLPKVPPEKDLEFSRKANELSPQQKKIGARAWAGILLMFVSMTIGMVYLLKMAIFIQEAGIGDSVMAGLASSSTTLTALVVSLAFAQLFKHLRRSTVLVPCRSPCSPSPHRPLACSPAPSSTACTLGPSSRICRPPSRGSCTRIVGPMRCRCCPWPCSPGRRARRFTYPLPRG